MKILSVFGTRPEAIKMAPIVAHLKREEKVKSYVCVTGQHRHMLDPFTDLFQNDVDFDLDIMRTHQTLTEVTQLILIRLKEVLLKLQPDLLLVQGDTTTAFAAALAAFYEKIPIAHIEAGLRTGNKMMPWPEEINRKLISCIAEHHFAPTIRSKQNLLKEGILEETILVTGNPVIDTLFFILEKFKQNPKLKSKQFDFLDPQKKLILVTAHRRENFGKKLEEICLAIAQIAKRDDVEIIYPVHLNPNVQKIVHSLLRAQKNIHLIEPLDYLDFVYLMNLSHLILSDSGGVQEEAPSLGKPVLVMREVTERPEAIEAGTVLLVGTNQNAILQKTTHLLDDPDLYKKMAQAHNPYGDGHASQRIIQHLLKREVVIV